MTGAIIQQLVIRNDFCLFSLYWNSCAHTLTFIYVQGASGKVLRGLDSFTHILPLRGPFTHASVVIDGRLLGERLEEGEKKKQMSFYQNEMHPKEIDIPSRIFKI